MPVLSLDLGSTSFKAFIYDSRLHLLGEGTAYLEYAQFAQRVELLTDEVSSAAEKAVREGIENARISPASIEAVAITSQAQTFALRDRATWRTPFISWQDQRGAAWAKAMLNEPVFADFSRQTSFYQPVAGMMICLWRALLDEDPDLRKAEPVPLPAFLIEQMTGHTVLDENMAAMTGLWSMPDRSWNENYIDWVGSRQEGLPGVVALQTPAGYVQEGNHFNLPPGIPVYPAGNDQTAGAFSAGLQEDGGMLVTLGSAQVVYQCVSRSPDPCPGMIRGMYPGDGFYRMIADSYGGNLIARACKELGLTGYDTFFSLAESGFSKGSPMPEVHAEAELLFGQEYNTEDLCCAAVIDFLSGRMASFVRRLQSASAPLYLAQEGGARNRVWKERLEAEIGRTLVLRPAAPGLGAARQIASPVLFGNGARDGKNESGGSE